MFSPPATAGGNSVVSPMFSPPLPGQAGYAGFTYGNGQGYERVETGVAERLNIKVGLTPMIGGKKFSQRSLEQRNRERESYFADLSVQPLNPGRRAEDADADGNGNAKLGRKWRSGRKNTY